MANCINYECDDALGTHLQNDCGEELLGGSSGILLLECDHQLTDPSSASEINAEIAAGRATLITSIKVGMDAASAIEVDSNVSCGSQVLVNYDRTFSLVDGNVNNNNIDMYNQMFKGHKLGGVVLYLCGTAEADAGEKVLWIDTAVNAVGSLIVPNQNTEFQRFEGTFRWRSKNNPAMYTAPVGIF
jgi:hypothetical protein